MTQTRSTSNWTKRTAKQNFALVFPPRVGSQYTDYNQALRGGARRGLVPDIYSNINLSVPDIVLIGVC